MNVFEDLIGELKDENLLEDTVIQVRNGGFHDAGGVNGKVEFAIAISRSRKTASISKRMTKCWIRIGRNSVHR